MLLQLGITVAVGSMTMVKFVDWMKYSGGWVTDAELADLIAWLRDPDWSREGWAATLLQGEGMIR